MGDNRFLASLLVWLSTASAVSAQLPQARLFTVFPPGGKQGTTFEVVVTGQDLDEAKRLRFSHPGIDASPVMAEATPFHRFRRSVPGRFTLNIADDVPPGVYDLRVVGRYGVSNPRAFVVGDRPEVTEQSPNQSTATATQVALGMVVNGSAEADGADYFKFSAQTGQRILVNCWAERIDSRMDATLVLYDAKGAELSYNRDHNRRDPLLDFTAPASSEYVLKVHDFLYRGGEEYFYRFSIGTGPHLDFVFPPAGEPGSKGKYLLYGRNLPGGTPSKLSIDGRPLEQKTVEIELPVDGGGERETGSLPFLEPDQVVWDGIEYRLASSQGVSNSVRVGLATAPVVVEQEPNDAPLRAQKLRLPCEVAGQFFPAGDRDWFTFEAEEKSVYWIEVFSRRMGLATDPALLIQQLVVDAEGKAQTSEVAKLDDPSLLRGDGRYNHANRDPVFRFEADGSDTYRVQVRDLYGGGEGNPSHLYRLSIRKARPDFHLLTVTEYRADHYAEARVWMPYLRKGETISMRVFAIRRDGFEGEI